MTTTLTGKNQVTVPVHITQKMGLVAGTRFDWAVGDGVNQIIITVKPTRRQLLDRLRLLSEQSAISTNFVEDSLLAERREDDQMREEALR